MTIKIKSVREKTKQHHCTICDKSYLASQHLTTRHIKSVHKKIKNYQCNICEKSFATFSTLKDHIIVHEGQKNHKCNMSTIFYI